MCAISNWMRQLDNLVMKGCKFYSLKKDLNLPLPGCRVILFVMVGYNVTDTPTPVYCINKTRDFRQNSNFTEKVKCAKHLITI